VGLSGQKEELLPWPLALPLSPPLDTGLWQKALSAQDSVASFSAQQSDEL